MAQLPQGKKIYKEYSTSAPLDLFRIGRDIWTLKEDSLYVFTYYDYTSAYDITESEYLLEDFDKDLHANEVPKIITRKNIPLKLKKEKTLDSKSGLFLSLKLVGNTVKKWNTTTRQLENFFTPSDPNIKLSHLQLESDNSFTLTIVYQFNFNTHTPTYFAIKKIYRISDLGIVTTIYSDFLYGNLSQAYTSASQVKYPAMIRSCIMEDKVYFITYDLIPGGVTPDPPKSELERIADLEILTEDIQNQISTGVIKPLPTEPEPVISEPGILTIFATDLNIGGDDVIKIEEIEIPKKLLQLSNMVYDEVNNEVLFAFNEMTTETLEDQPTLKGSKTNFVKINKQADIISIFDSIEHFDASFIELIKVPNENIFNFRITCKQEFEDYVNSKYVYKMENKLLNHKPFVINESFGKVMNFTTDEENIFIFYHNDEFELNMLIYNIEAKTFVDRFNISEGIANGFLIRLFEPQSEFIYADKAIFTCALWNEDIHPESHDYLMKLDLLTVNTSNFIIHTPLHGRQLSKRKFCNGKNGNLYISNWNTGDVLKVDTINPNTYLALRIDYTPDLIKFDERSDKILVHTDKDKIVAINRQTDETVVILNTMGVCTAISDLTSDNAYWFVSEDFATKMNIDKTTMLRTKKKVKKPLDVSEIGSPLLTMDKSLGITDKTPVDPSDSSANFKTQVNIALPNNDSKLNAMLGFKIDDLPEVVLEYEEVDYSFTLTGADWLKSVTKFLVIPEYYIINHNNGQPLLIHEYIVALTNGGLYLFRNKRNYYEDNYIEITGQGMVYSGNDFYTGESI